MNVALIADVRDDAGELIRGLRVGPFNWYVIDLLAVLTLITRHHVYWLLEQVEIKVLIRKRRSKVEVAVYKRLGAGVE